MDYKPGKFETQKFEDRKEPYYAGLKEIQSLGYDTTDFLHYFPSFVGHMALARFLRFMKLTNSPSASLATLLRRAFIKGAGTLFFAKLARIFEPESLTLVHGFDWFEGSKELTAEEANVAEGSYKEDYERLMRLIRAQQLERIVHIHRLDLRTELGAFFAENSYMQFKLVLLDAGLYSVVKSCIEHFWPRLTSGGVLVFDQFNFELAPGETRAIKECLPEAQIRTFPFCWMPTAYIVKP